MNGLERPAYLALLIIFLLSCEGDVGPSGINSLIDTADEPPGLNCAAGGLRVAIGLDSNKNGTLEQSEVQSTQFICNGINGTNSLVNTSNITPGIDCSNGGIKLEVGVDIDRNGLLEPEEVQSITFICNGADGISIDQVRFQLVSLVGLGSSSTTGDLSPPWMYLKKFKKSDFSLMQSAIFSAHISTENSTSASICTVDLFNLTDNVAISGSEVTTNSTARVWVNSGNFMNNIPDKEIDVAIRLRTNSAGGFANCIQAYLILSKN